MTAKSKAISKAELGRQDQFALNYVMNGENGSRAYQDAYPKAKADNARMYAYRLLQKGYVRERIKHYRKQQHELLMATHEEVLQEVVSQALFDPINMFDEDGRLLTLDQMDGPTRKMVNELEMVISDDDGTPFRMAKIKYGKEKRAYLDMLMKHYNQYEAHRVAGAVHPMTVYIHPADENL